jgi:hypothetical protein
LLDETLAKVWARWDAESLGPIPSLDDAQLRNKLDILGVEASDEILQVFSYLNGFDDDEMDSECFSFWSIDRMIEENSQPAVSRDRSFVHFADFLIFSHTYAFKQNTSELVSVYCHYDYDCIRKVADSFEEFFGYYLTTDQKLWPD